MDRVDAPDRQRGADAARGADRARHPRAPPGRGGARRSRPLSDEAPYNPLDKRNLGKSVAEAILERAAVPLREIGEFRGAGVYALYYTGDFAAYRPLAERNRGGAFEAPIYVGKAVSQGARKGALDLDAPPGKVLSKRLREHRESIVQAANLDLDDFHCRYLVVEDIWVPLGESLLIQRTNPLWNLVVDGFGNHDPGKGRHAGQQPLWDVLHPGRPWAARLAPNAKSRQQLAVEIRSFLAARYGSPKDP